MVGSSIDLVSHSSFDVVSFTLCALFYTFVHMHLVFVVSWLRGIATGFYASSKKRRDENRRFECHDYNGSYTLFKLKLLIL
jgi:hypothetical protein